MHAIAQASWNGWPIVIRWPSFKACSPPSMESLVIRSVTSVYIRGLLEIGGCVGVAIGVGLRRATTTKPKLRGDGIREIAIQAEEEVERRREVERWELEPRERNAPREPRQREAAKRRPVRRRLEGRMDAGLLLRGWRRSIGRRCESHAPSISAREQPWRAEPRRELTARGVRLLEHRRVAGEDGLEHGRVER